MSYETSMKWLSAALIALVATLMFHAYDKYVPYGVRYVGTTSIPTGFYLSKTYVHGSGLAAGEFVCFKPSLPEWRRLQEPSGFVGSFCKKVLAVPGYTLTARGPDRFAIAGSSEVWLGKVLSKDSLGRPVQPAALPETPIPPGMYWLGGLNHPNSFDSRYLGLVEDQSIEVVLTPLR